MNKSTIWTDGKYEWKFLYINDERLSSRYAIVTKSPADKTWAVVTTFDDRIPMLKIMEDFIERHKLSRK